MKRPKGLLPPLEGMTIRPYFDSHTNLQDFSLEAVY